MIWMVNSVGQACHRLPGNLWVIRIPPNEKSPCSPEGTRTEKTILRYHLACRKIRPPHHGANTPSALNAGNASVDTQGGSLFPLPSAAHLLLRFSLRSQLCGTLCGCAGSFTPASLVSYGFTNVYKVPNPLSQELESEIRSMAPAVKRLPRRILFVGHVLPSKGVYELVNACSGINDIELRVVGRVEDKVKDELQSLASVSAGKWLNILGEKSQEEVLHEMLSCEIFVLPSYTEGFPNVIIEAMACGAPIIATGVGAIP